MLKWYNNINLGFILGNTMLVRADHPYYTAEQITRHENGWVRDNDVISAGHWKTFTTNFADVVVFAKGTIESPEVTKIIKINASKNQIIEDTIGDIYEAERKGIRREIGEVFVYYNKSDFFGERINQGNSTKSLGNNNRPDTKRSGSEIKTNPITEFHVDEDRGIITFTYANGEVATEKLSEGKTSRDFSSPEEATKTSKASRELDTEYLSAVNRGDMETAHMVNEMKPYANILPQDKVDKAHKTLVKNGSYDVSVENTTVCIRTLAYNDYYLLHKNFSNIGTK